jgi:hypothetical protein
MPVCSTVPIALPGPGSLFLARSPADYVAFALVTTRFVWSADGRRMSNTWRSQREQKKAGNLLSDEAKAEIFDKLQEEYRTVAGSIDPADRTALDRWIAAHNWRVLHNKMDTSLSELGNEADAMAKVDFYNIARHVDNTFRFKFNPVRMPFYMFLDETGVSAGSESNAELRKSAFYDFLAQLRKFGGRITYATHEPMLVWKQMRDITDMFDEVHSFDLPKGRFYLVLGYRTVQNFQAKKGARGIDWAFVSYDDMSRYPTGWIVTPPPPMAHDRGA